MRTNTVNAIDICSDMEPEAVQAGKFFLDPSYERGYPVTPEEINRYFVENENLIHKVVQRYRGSDDYNDLFQIAAIGFFKGVKTFDPKKGVKLSTYAYDCADNELKMHIRRNSAGSRTAVLVSLDAEEDGNNGREIDSLYDKDLAENDSLHAPVTSMEEAMAQKDLVERILKVVDEELTFEQSLVIYRYMHNVPQADTARELNISQPSVSKLQKLALCELVIKLQEKGIVRINNDADKSGKRAVTLVETPDERPVKAPKAADIDPEEFEVAIYEMVAKLERILNKRNQQSAPEEPVSDEPASPLEDFEEDFED